MARLAAAHGGGFQDGPRAKRALQARASRLAYIRHLLKSRISEGRMEADAAA